jgi:oligopeptide/dipeptide ABC transporter ATP-binding protein
VINTNDVVLEAKNVTKTYPRRSGVGADEKALDVINVVIRQGETLGIVGESGSGKTTLSRLMLGIERPTEGTVYFRGVPISDLDRDGRRNYRRSVAAVFQNPYSSLDPKMRIWQLITEQLVVEHRGTTRDHRERAVELLRSVGLEPGLLERFPRQLSGGQRQRVAIARALVSNPDIVILDEAIAALDVSVRAQIVNLLLDLQDRLSLTYTFIAHDLAVVQHLCHRTIVMYRGRIVEEGPSRAIFERPAHPYTAALIEASYIGSALREKWSAPAAPESQETPPRDGCIYQPRCPLATSTCVTVAPEHREMRAGHFAMCHYPMGVDRVQPADISMGAGSGPPARPIEDA